MRKRLSPARCRIAILGLGTVGSAVARRLTSPDAPPALDLTHIFDRRATQKRDAFASSAPLARRITWTDAIGDILASDVDVVVEARGGVEPAREWIGAALAAGKAVVTANKQVIARHGSALLALGERLRRPLRFEAAVGGAMPIVRAVANGLAGDRITRIVAILNGTTNASRSGGASIRTRFQRDRPHRSPRRTSTMRGGAAVRCVNSRMPSTTTRRRR
jgi:homoserine dehydrogenase